ncbi:universal stress protein [Massilia scottii]|uniref:universal stress protein n=1 Tax=Massilia scottii TaxID=3057166 RepID=UPI002796DC53|nr:universal stress protein [Massilia sp. CCM 9029]MDQ1833549.1 universal stress protein [Massilia sp. CCM 9029]
MSLKTIVVHIDQTQRCSTQIKLAAQLAIEYEAHLIGVAPTGWSPLLVLPGVSAPMLPVATVDTLPARTRCESALAAFESQVRLLDVASVETRLVEEEVGLALATHGYCSDLIIVGQASGADTWPGARSDFPEWVMLNGPVPVLVVPARGEFASVGTRVVVAWNGSSEARRAIGSALPVLRKADKVHLLIINTGSNIVDGTDMGLYLERHGVNVEVDVDTSSRDAGQALIAASAYCGADLLVMGAYGRARLREMLMGGASRTILASMQLPVWMAH